jgi:hypothetical protein
MATAEGGKTSDPMRTNKLRIENLPPIKRVETELGERRHLPARRNI